MSEREPSSNADQDKPGDWDVAVIAEHLAVVPEPVEDIAFGEGSHFRFEDAGLSVEVYPGRSFIRLCNADVLIEAHRMPAPTLGDDGIIFARERPDGLSMLSVTRGGEATLFLSSQPRTEQLGIRQVSAPVPSASEQQRGKEAERVTLSGRLGATPTFRETPKGRKKVAQFPLAVRDAATDKTTWHTIVAFDARAERLQAAVNNDELPKGASVQVIGYRHTREVPTRNGGNKKVTEIYAVAVRAR